MKCDKCGKKVVKGRWVDATKVGRAVTRIERVVPYSGRDNAFVLDGVVNSLSGRTSIFSFDRSAFTEEEILTVFKDQDDFGGHCLNCGASI